MTSRTNQRTTPHRSTAQENGHAEEGGYSPDQEKPRFIGDHFKIHTMQQILKSSGEPPPWIIANFLRRQGLATFSGRAKSFKTWDALDLCMSVAMGDPWHGMETKQSPSVYVNLELSEESLFYRVRRLAEAKKIELASLKGWFLPVTINTSSLRVDINQAGLEEMFCSELVEQVIRAVCSGMNNQPGVAVVDSFYKFHGGVNENDPAQVEMAYSYLRRLSSELKSSVVGIHHFAKGDPGEKLAGDRAAGSRVHLMTVDTYVEYVPHREDGVVIFEALLRDYAPKPKFCLRWQAPLLELELDLDPEEIRRPPRRSGETSKVASVEVLAILEAMQPASGPDWQGQCKAELGLSRATFYRAVSDLQKRKKVFKSGPNYAVSKAK